MALTKLGGTIHYPYRFMATSQEVIVSSSMAATGRQVHFVGQVFLENPTGGSKTISAAGGGLIAWRSASSAVFNNAGTQLDIGIQDLDMTISATPSRGDGTFDVSATLIGGTDSLGGSGTKETAMESGSKTLNHGDFIAVAFNMVSRGGTDSVSIGCSAMGDYNDQTKSLPSVNSVTSGTWTTILNGTPQVVIVFDDGTIGWLSEGLPPMSQSSSTVNTGSTPDEVGNYIKLRTKVRVLGFNLDTVLANNSSTFDIVIYSTPLGTPSVVTSYSLDPDQFSTSGGSGSVLLSTPVVLTPGEYGIILKPTTTNNITAYFYQVLTIKYMRAFGMHEDDFYAISRTDGSGAFAAWHAGTAKERRVVLQLLIDMVDVAGEAQSSMGIF